MKLTVFHANQGDCLLLTSEDGKHVLVDGGPRATTFDRCVTDTLTAIRIAREQIDLAVVTHIDADHINGIHELVDRVIKWKAHAYKLAHPGGRTGSPPPPPTAQPPTVAELWHNSWVQQTGEAAADRASSALARVAELDTEETFLFPDADRPVVDVIRNLAEGITTASKLQKLVDTEPSPIPRNPGFYDRLVTLTDPPHQRRVGGLNLTVLGPSGVNLEHLRELWNDSDGTTPPPHAGTAPGTSAEPSRNQLRVAIDQGRPDAAEVGPSAAAVVAAVTKAIHPPIGRVSGVTAPNRASIIVLAEEGEPASPNHRSCLLTGDCAHEDIVQGLVTAFKRHEDEPFWCDVLKVQHHGSEYNMDEKFPARVLARHYVFCADGLYDNPDPAVVAALIQVRAEHAPTVPFTLWFNCSLDDAAKGHEDALMLALNTAWASAGGAAEKHRQPDLVTVRILKTGQHYFDVCLCQTTPCGCAPVDDTTTAMTATFAPPPARGLIQVDDCLADP